MSNRTTTCPEGTRGYAEANPGNCVWYQSPIPLFDEYLAAPCCSVITGIADPQSGNANCYQRCPVTSANVNQTWACLNSTFQIAQITPAADIVCYYMPAKSQGSILRAGNIIVVLLPLMGLVLAFASGNVL